MCIRDRYFGPLTGNEDLLRAFARYTAALHEAGICHQDYSPGNVLVNGEGDCFQFALIDINRMKFRQMDLKKGCKNLMRMFENEELSLIHISMIRSAERSSEVTIIISITEFISRGGHSTVK